MDEKKEKLLSGLNTDQSEAVIHDEGSMLVLAGAGSGKTRVLTTRIAWLVKERSVHLENVLAVTFTSKAAKEMMHRVATMLSVDVKPMWIGTFHSIALRLLTKHYSKADLPSYFQVLDSQDQVGLLKRLIKSSNLDEDRYPAKELQKFINSQKEQGLRASDLVPDGLRSEHWISLYAEYEKVCNRDGFVDFTELLLRSYEMLMKHRDLLEHYHGKFEHILIDEFQDTNQLQYQWIKLLGGDGSSLFAVGDDDQSIYSFRGAKITNMKSFLKDFHIKEPIRLEQNYRSTPNILDAANAVIGNNADRIGKKLWTKNNSGEQIQLYEGYTEEDEAYYVADEIKKLQNDGFSLSDMAILYRSNAQSRVFEQFFYGQGIAYRVFGGLKFFERQEVKQVLSYLRLLVNGNDNEAFLRVINFPARGIGAKTIEILQAIAEEKTESLFQACDSIEGKSKQNIIDFISLIKRMREGVDSLSLSEIINYVIEESGIGTHYREDKRNGIERLENLNELVSAVANFRHEEGISPLNAFLSHAVLESGDHNLKDLDQAVQLMTVHAAKGLEFKVVFIVGLEDGLFPHQNGIDIGNLEEERRLMYVAVTRARERLYLLRACSRLLWGKRQSAPMSRFVSEIPGALINNISGISKIGCNSLSKFGVPETETLDATPEIFNPETKISRVELSDKALTIKIGDMVKHAKFGNGRVMQLHVDGAKTTAEIFFVGVGKKTLDLNIAKIEKA